MIRFNERMELIDDPAVNGMIKALVDKAHSWPMRLLRMSDGLILTAITLHGNYVALRTLLTLREHNAKEILLLQEQLLDTTLSVLLEDVDKERLITEMHCFNVHLEMKDNFDIASPVRYPNEPDPRRTGRFRLVIGERQIEQPFALNTVSDIRSRSSRESHWSNSSAARAFMRYARDLLRGGFTDETTLEDEDDD